MTTMTHREQLNAKIFELHEKPYQQYNSFCIYYHFPVVKVFKVFIIVFCPHGKVYLSAPRFYSIHSASPCSQSLPTVRDAGFEPGTTVSLVCSATYEPPLLILFVVCVYRITRLDLAETRIASIHSGLDFYTHLLILNISHRSVLYIRVE